MAENGDTSTSEHGATHHPWSNEEFRAHAHAMVDFIADYYRDIEQYPVRSKVSPGFLKELLPDHAPEDGEPWEAVMKDVQAHIMPGITHWQSPNFFAYYPANSSYPGMLGEFLSAAFNTIGFSWINSPAATELEMIVLDWLGKALQLPESFLTSGHKGGGVIQGTASEAALVALLAARARALQSCEDNASRANANLKLVCYTSDHGFPSLKKACMIAGISVDNFRYLPTEREDNYALRPEVLASQIADDRAAGLIPFFLMGTVGTTSSTAVDPIAELALITSREDVWFHIDAAYAGSALICPEYRHYLDGVELADSLGVNAHKWLLTNFDCSALWVKDASWLQAALSVQQVFLRNAASDTGLVVDYKDWQIPLGRRFRALKLWFVLRAYGLKGLRTHIRKHCEYAKLFESWVLKDDRFESLAPTLFSLVCFRLKPPADRNADGNVINQQLLDAVNDTGKLFMTHTVLSGIFTLRIAIGAAMTELRHVEAAWELIAFVATRLVDAKP
eukprot:jgi/Chlat1/2001/Chrsp158S00128